MSSHHVIRDNQEAAVVVLSLENCSFEILGDALEWSPLVIVKVGVASQLIHRGYKIDLVLGADQDQVNQLNLEQRHVNFQKQSENHLQETIKLAHKNQHPAVIIFTKFDEEVISQIEKPQLPVSIIDGTLKWTFINTGEVKKWFAKGDIMQLKSVDKVRISEGIEAKPTNTIAADGIVKLKSARPFWLGESLI